EAPPPLFRNASLTRGGAVGNPLAIAISPSGRGPAGPTPAIRLRLSYLEPGQLLSSPQPQYPALARQAGIQGRVVLTAIIGRSGEIETLLVKSGQPLLARAAEAAVKQWRYRPYILNGEAVEVETQIIVDFSLAK